MRIRPVVAVLPAALLAVTGCSSEPPEEDSPAALVVQAERVADLLDGQRPCRTIEALHLLEELGGADPRPEVRGAVMKFVLSARSTVSCPAGGDSPSPSAPAQAPVQPEAPAEPDPGPEEPQEPDPPGRDQPPGQDEGNGNGNEGNGGKPGRGRGGG